MDWKRGMKAEGVVELPVVRWARKDNKVLGILSCSLGSELFLGTVAPACAAVVWRVGELGWTLSTGGCGGVGIPVCEEVPLVRH